MNPHWLPCYIEWNQISGESWEQYENRLFHVFLQDFKDAFLFEGKLVKYKRMPYHGVYPDAFIHLTTCKQDESGERLPDPERSRRLKWIKPTITHHAFCDVCHYNECIMPRVWRVRKRHEVRLNIFLPSQQYLVVLGERNDYWVLITAYYVNRPHSLEKLKREYDSVFSEVVL